MALPLQAGATKQKQQAEAASGCRVGVCTIPFGDAAPRLLDNGYQPIPIVSGQKRPSILCWQSIQIDAAILERWAEQYATCGIGLRTGALVGIDIDILDPDLAHRVDLLARDRLGQTLTRVGLWPKRLLPYRTETPLPKITCGNSKGAKVEFLGHGQQFVAFGIHPDTGQPYYWLDDSPLDLPFGAAVLAATGQSYEDVRAERAAPAEVFDMQKKGVEHGERSASASA